MKVLSFFFAILLMIPTLRAGDLKVKFTDKSWDEAKAQAKAEGKLFYVDFDASYSAVCRNMDESTYMDDNLAWFISQNAIAKRLDVQGFEGIRWAQQYELESLPMMILFNSDGKEVRRFTGYHTGRQLLDILSKFATPNNMKASKPKAGATTIEKPAPPKPATTSTPKPTTPVVKPTPTPAPKPPVAPSKPAAPTIPESKPSATGKGKGEYYELVTPSAPPKGYFVQLAAVADPTNLLPEATAFHKKYPKYRIFTYSTEINGKTYYRLLVGLFETRTEADQLNKTLKEKGYKTIVKTSAEI